MESSPDIYWQTSGSSAGTSSVEWEGYGKDWSILWPYSKRRKLFSRSMEGKSRPRSWFRCMKGKAILSHAGATRACMCAYVPNTMAFRCSCSSSDMEEAPSMRWWQPRIWNWTSCPPLNFTRSAGISRSCSTKPSSIWNSADARAWIWMRKSQIPRLPS